MPSHPLVTPLVTFSGLDGAGKTTQIDLLRRALAEQRRTAEWLTMYDDVSVAARLRRTARRLIPAGGPAPPRHGPSAAGGQRATLLRHDKNRSDRLTLALRRLVYLFDLCYFLLVCRRPAVRRSNLLVMDRYFFDSLANLVAAGAGARGYVGCFLRMAPEPRLAILLDIDADEAYRRKREYPLPYLQLRRQAYLDIFTRVRHPLILDARRSAASLHQTIAAGVEGLLDDRHRPARRRAER